MIVRGARCVVECCIELEGITSKIGVGGGFLWPIVRTGYRLHGTWVEDIEDSLFLSQGYTVASSMKAWTKSLRHSVGRRCSRLHGFYSRKDTVASSLKA